MISLLSSLYTKSDKKENAKCYFKQTQHKLEVLILKSDSNFEWSQKVINAVDAPPLYSQGKYSITDSIIVLNNSFFDSVTLKVNEENKISLKSNIYPPYITINCLDPNDDMKFLSYIDYDILNDDKNKDLYLCLLCGSGQVKYKKYDFDKKTFGKIYYESKPYGFYIMSHNQVVSKKYTISNLQANYFDIAIITDNRKYIYDYKTNYLHKKKYVIENNNLIDRTNSDTFRLYNKNILAKGIQDILYEIEQDPMINKKL